MIVQLTILQLPTRALMAAMRQRGAHVWAGRLLDVLMLMGAGYLISNVIALALAGA
jgi:hypothetical protein